MNVDGLGLEVLEILEENCKIGPGEIADMTDYGEEEVRKKISELEEKGIIKKYKAVVDWRSAGEEIGYASIDLKVELSRESGYDEIAERIANFPEIETIRLISGEYDLRILVRGESMRNISSFVAEKISTLESVRDTVTHFVLKTYKEDGELFFERECGRRLSVSP